MTTSELIVRLQQTLAQHGDLPVIHWDGGDVNYIQVGFDTLKNRKEVWLHDALP